MSFATFMQGVSPFGPIFAKELRTTARRRRTYFIRVVYMALLLLGLLLVYLPVSTMNRYGGIAMRNQQQSMLGQFFFAFFGVFSVWIMGLLGPILTATAISSERLHKTLPVLLMTPITAWQIVAGKLFSRLLIALTLIGLGLPVLALVRLLGGVELDRMLGVIALAMVAAISSAAIGLFFSTVLNRAYAVILLSFGTMLLLYLFVPFVIALSLHAAGGPRSEIRAMEIILSFHPYALSWAAAIPEFSRLPFALPWGWCIGSHLAFASLLLLWSASILRRRARREGESSTGTPVANVVSAPAPPPIPASTATENPATPPLPIPLSYAPADLKKKHRPREVTDNPILWREIRRPLMARRWQRIVGACLCIFLLLLVYCLLAINRDLADPDGQKAWACIFNFFFAGLVNVLASTAIAQEKDSDTWTLLIATPISGQTIVWGKALGVMRRLLFPMLLIAAHFLIFAIFRVVSFTAALSGIWIIITFNTIWVATGVYFSLRFNKVTLAVICNFLLAFAAYLIVFAVLGVCTALLEGRRNGPLEEVDPRTIDHVVSSVFVIASLIWVATLFLAFRRSRGALGQLMISTLFFITILAVFAARMHWIEGRNLYAQSGWYTPYFYLVDMDWSWNQRRDFWLPTGESVLNDGSMAVLVLFFFVGSLHMLLAAGILWMSGRKFSALVGRAPQLRQLDPKDIRRDIRDRLLPSPTI